MAASVVSMDGDVVTLEVKVKLSGSMLEAEESILTALNEAGCLATGKALERFDPAVLPHVESAWRDLGIPAELKSHEQITM